MRMDAVMVGMAVPVAAALMALAGSEVGAQPKLESGTRLIVVDPVPEQLSLRANLNKGSSNPGYRVGEPIQVRVQPSQDAYIYLFSVEADGQIQLILPNRFAPAAFVRAGQTQTFPGNGARFQFTVSPPFGQARVLVVASRTRLGSRDLAFFRNGYGSVAQQTLQSQSLDPVSKAIVVEPSEYPWVTRSLYYRVAR